ncbi:DUF2771 family protein [Actinokineospora auranticolor]|uniref:Uncharacterized protein DUF2771 n=1 Tax=Actinokineospora auranticolor TaxID=155976 RepID=A0A2S6GZ59_9PSEU|nr:DUF2771 family protein [Actinokineospora auranticolor]PPK70519.1 uncharacterized protein DUF2771 [Actinokineospora auranticolor]
MRRVLTAALTCVTVAVVAGCAPPPKPEVTFYSDGNSVSVGPVNANCPDGVLRGCKTPVFGSLRMRMGKTVQISVPSEISESPWGVTFSYANGEGRIIDGSSKLFFPQAKQHAFTLDLPSDDDTLLMVIVQKVAFPDANRPATTGMWVLQGDLDRKK